MADAKLSKCTLESDVELGLINKALCPGLLLMILSPGL